jgi:hypothetical protein
MELITESLRITYLLKPTMHQHHSTLLHISNHATKLTSNNTYIPLTLIIIVPTTMQ